MAKTPDSAAPSSTDAAGPLSQGGSIWPDTAHLRSAGASTLFELSHFDPVIAAEMEHESALSDA